MMGMLPVYGSIIAGRDAARLIAGRTAARRPNGRRAAPRETTDLREAILAATAGLLADRQFGELAVSDILTAAGVSRGSFYFYFDSKQDVLAELVRRAVARGTRRRGAVAGRPRPTRRPRCAPGSPPGRSCGRQSAPILRAIVENWRDRPAPGGAVDGADADLYRRHGGPDQRRPARPAGWPARTSPPSPPP